MVDSVIDSLTCTKLTSEAKDGVSRVLPDGRRGHTAVVHLNAMYIYGGYVDMKGSSGELWSFDFGNLTSSKLIS